MSPISGKQHWPSGRLAPLLFLLSCTCLLSAHARAAGTCSVSTFGSPFVSGVGATRAVVVADFNGDGKPDVAAANEFSNDVSVLLGNGDGTFAPDTRFPAGQLPRSIDAGDFNGDGKLDLVTGNDIGGVNGDLTLVFGDGAGRFPTKKAVIIQSSAPPTVSFVTVADFNKDGKADLLAGQASREGVVVLLGDGAGNFPNQKFYVTGARPSAGAVADFNEDGKTDLAVTANFFGAVSILTGDGAGGFSAVGSFNAGPFPTSITTGDFNGDGRTDIATTNLVGSTVSILLGDGSGAFAPPASYDGGGQGLASIAAADFNGDGFLDLAVGNEDVGNVLILQGDGAGHFSAASNYIGGAYAALSLSAKDLNGDGMPDLIVGYRDSSSVASLLNTCGAAPPTSAVQFNSPTYVAQEASGLRLLPVVRTGSLAGAASVDYATADGTATARQDYTAAYGQLQFAPGETSKIVRVVITGDRLDENDENFTVALSNPAGVVPGASANAQVIIRDDDSADGPSPVGDTAFDTDFFVRQHYADFLSREPDSSGLNFWKNEIDSCGQVAVCREVKKINVSAAFFLSIEFQETGYLAYRTYKAAYGDAASPNVAGTVPVIRLGEFLPDAQRIGRDVQVNVGSWEQQLEANKNAFVLEFVQRQRFVNAFPVSMTPASFVDKLNQNAGGVLSQPERNQLVAELSAAADQTQGRAAALRKVAEDTDLRNNEKNRAFVLMQYYGYLRRNPDDPQDTDFRGWRFWLDKLNQFGGNYVGAEMVKAFITSDEYRKRFGQ
jgi:hypothetical protein